jgi:dolichol-phosphate mannosyltransferase
VSPSISIVIPFHNEAETLPKLLNALDAALSELDRDYEVIFVDDCSTDAGPVSVQQAISTRHWLQLIHLSERGGQTGAFRTAFAEARGEWIIRMDADMQDDPADLQQFLSAIDSGLDVVIGFRDERKHNFFDKLLTATYDLVVLFLFNTPLRSFSGSFVAFRASCVKGAPLKSNDHRYLPLIALRRGGERVGQVFVRHHRRTHGSSKYKTWKKFAYGPFELLRFFLRFRTGFYDKPKA